MVAKTSLILNESCWFSRVHGRFKKKKNDDLSHIFKHLMSTADSVQGLIWVMLLTEDIVLPVLPDLPRLRLDEEL